MADQRAKLQQGGFWSAPQVQYSKQTHDLLKEMMKESKLTNFQQRHLEKSLRGGSSLPTACAPTTSARPRQKKPPPKPSKIINPRTYSGGVRTKDTMEEMGAFQKSDYVPPRQNTRSAREKEKLANIMAYGEDMDPIPMARVRKRVDMEIGEVSDVDRFQELQDEINERRNFLADMEKLGQGAKYKGIIETEVSQKIREMEVIDNKKTAELKRLIEEDDRNKAVSKGIPQPSVS
ncbi:UPF0193 protein EVG1-like [Haliotis rubra]|uniref:UPF0193 protein EVG1-like n=1 Tax=Haliotis rubra TaxID=36100 RepID=UPI001EE4FBFD|nr:UPF0193 protein EVG1-like [Haliotis rubra]XP_046581941.1 UPF0193 protein EVG1-like [Haliotis rubra]